MKGELRPILEFLEGKSNKYYIPVYQRNYDWKKENCERLFNDLVDVVREDRRSHFFGSIVYARLTDEGSHDFNIIDGQQRITTLLLLLIAICRNIEDGYVTTENDELRDMIWEEYIVAKWGKDKRKIRLKPIKKDCESFDSIVLNNNLEEYNQSSNITRNYMYFYNTVKNGILSVDDLYEAITKLQTMDKGFNYSAFRLNVFVKNCTRWSQEEITQRADELCTVAKKLWAIPQTTFVAPAKRGRSYGFGRR